MVGKSKKLLLVGDNPFHGISHLSQEKARARGREISQTDFAANLVTTSLNNGANGFMFSVSETTLSIVDKIGNIQGCDCTSLYAIVPYAYEYVRLATRLGISGLSKKLGKGIILSGNLRAFALGFKGLARMDIEALLKAYLSFEISRIKSAARNRHKLSSVLLHEIITDMGLALNLDWLFKSYIDFLQELGTKPGFETRNFAFLVAKFKEWNIDFRKITLVAPFNKIGFQMNPSRKKCETALSLIPESQTIGMSILAAGYLNLHEASEYIKNRNNLQGVVVGVSKNYQASETFDFLSSKLGT
jgi:hypothetical protein